MNTASISKVNKVRFLAVNFARLQGLRALPFGLGIFLTALWANAQHGPARNFLLPALIVLLCGGMYLLIDRYYKRSFGRVVASAESRKKDWITSVIGGAVALAAFLADNFLHPPVNLIGLVFVAAILWEYVCISRYDHHWYAPITPLFAVPVILASLLPALGLGGWWQQVGAKHAMLGVCMVVGVTQILASPISHLYFIRFLPARPSHD